MSLLFLLVLLKLVGRRNGTKSYYYTEDV